MTQYNLLTEQTSTIIMYHFEYALFFASFSSNFQFQRVHFHKKSFRNKEKEIHLEGENCLLYFFFQLPKVNSSSFTEASSLKEDGINIALI